MESIVDILVEYVVTYCIGNLKHNIKLLLKLSFHVTAIGGKFRPDIVGCQFPNLEESNLLSLASGFQFIVIMINIP